MKENIILTPGPGELGWEHPICSVRTHLGLAASLGQRTWDGWEQRDRPSPVQPREVE